MILEVKESDMNKEIEQMIETEHYHEIESNLKKRKDFFSKLFERDEKEVDEEDESNEKKFEKKGGSYKEVKGGEGDKYHVHHMPAKSASDLKEEEGPAIKMEIADHKLTASWGNSREAREYQAQQRKLFTQGKFREALQMDIDDIHEKFGDKYNEAITEMLIYVDKLEREGKIDG